MGGKFLGKIQTFRVGFGGYDDAMIGYWFTLSYGGGYGVGGGKGPWTTDITSSTKWTEADRSRQLEEVMRDLWKFLKQAKKREVGQLVGVPVEVEIVGGTLKSWRVLEEVL